MWAGNHGWSMKERFITSQRGNNREYIFKNDEDKSYLLKRIEDCKQKWDLIFWGMW